MLEIAEHYHIPENAESEFFNCVKCRKMEIKSKPEKDAKKVEKSNIIETPIAEDDNIILPENDNSETKEIVVETPEKVESDMTMLETESEKEEVADIVVSDKEKEPIAELTEGDTSNVEVSEQAAMVVDAEKGSETEKVGAVVEQAEMKEDNSFIDYDGLDREQLLVLLEEIVNNSDVTKIKQKVALIKVSFMKLNKLKKEEKLKAFIDEGGIQEEYEEQLDEVEEKFRLLFDIYKQNKAKFNANLEEQKRLNLELKKKVLEELKELINSEETLKNTYDEFKILQDRWKEIGLIPQNEINNLWQSYHFLVEMFFDKVKINKELRDLDLKKNLELKMELCEKAEELLLESSITKSFKDLQKFHEQWKEIGPAPNESRDEIWERFKAATDKINERRREYYENIHETQKQNLEAKTALCEKAEELCAVELKTLKEWQVYTANINELMEVWRGIGPAPKKYNDEIWRRFKGILNGFFEVKKDFFNQLKDQQLNNYNIKLDLCVQAEALKDSTDWQKTTNDLIRLQKEWKTIGPVPKKYSDKVWKRFRAACDDFFSKKSSFYSSANERETDNLKLKQDFIQKIKDFEFGDDKKENLKNFKDFQREWMNFGHVPIKEKDKIQKEFRKILDEIMGKLQIGEAEISAINYKSRFENMSDSKESRNILYKERTYLVSKISKIKDDIILWENNIGFFAASKNADLLKVEFEKKIQNAKNEVLILEAKLKVLNATEL